MELAGSQTAGKEKGKGGRKCPGHSGSLRCQRMGQALLSLTLMPMGGVASAHVPPGLQRQQLGPGPSMLPVVGVLKCIFIARTDVT